MSIMEWPEVIVKDVCESVIDCVNKTAPVVDYETPYKMIRTTNVKNGVVNIDSVRYVEKDVFEKWTRRAVPKVGDVILTREAPLGDIGMLTKSGEKIFLGQRLMQYRTDPEKLDNYFLLYALQESYMQGQLKAASSGSTVEHIRVGDAESLKIRLPELETQKKLSSILKAYDNLIENNNCRIAILEEMAQSLYREWFVKFCFPGHEDTKFIDSKLGKIPEGWEMSTLGEHLKELESGKRPKGGIKDIESGMPSVGAENINGIGRHKYSSEKLVPQEFFNGMKKGVVKDQDVAIYKDGAYIGRSTYFRDNFPHEEFCVNEHVFLLRSDNERITQNFLYLWLQHPETVSNIRATNANAAQPGINQQGIKGLKILLPTKNAMADFDRLVEPLLGDIIINAKRNRNLQEQRDLLLPKLISGKIKFNSI